MDVYSGLLFFLVSFHLRAAYSDRLPLCPEEKREPTVFADVGDNITLTICVIVIHSGGGLTLDSVYCLYRCSCQSKSNTCPYRPKERFSSTLVPRDGGHLDYHNLTISVDRIQEDFFGILQLLFSRDRRRRIDAHVQFAKKGIAFSSYNSDKRFIPGVAYTDSELYLMCESRDYPPSSLSIVQKYSKEILDTSVVDGVVVYHIESVQCSHMGTYVCFYNNDTSQNSTLDVFVLVCPPQLCYEEKKARTVFAALYENVSIELCVITWERFSLVLDSIFRHDNSEDKLLENRYESSLIPTKSTDLSHWKVNVTLRDIQENDLGQISIKLCARLGCLTYEMILEKKRMELKIYKSEQLLPVDKLFYVGDSLHLICESGGYHPSSLGIGKLYSKEILHAPVFDGNLVYHFERLQCSDMGTYVCFYKHDPSKNATVNVPVKFCRPQLCHVESRTRTIYASLNDNVIVDICVIYPKIPILTSVFRNGNTTDKLLKSRYEDSSISPMASQGLYWKVNFVLKDLQEEDFGNISVYIGSMNVTVLVRHDPPELCPKKNLTSTITADLYTNISFTLCLIAHDDLFVEKVYLRDRENNIVEENRYRITSENTRQDVYAVSIELFNIQKEDFGNVTFRLKHRPVPDLWMDYEIYLQQKLNGPPELCPKENLTRTITADLYTNISFTLCLIAHDDLFVEKVYLDDRENNTVEENRYRLTSENTRQDVNAVNIELFNIQKEDFGNVTFRLKHLPVLDLWMDYEIFLQQNLNVSEDSSLIIYVVLSCLTVVALILVGIYIYTKKGHKKSSTRTPDPYYVNEFNDGQPAALQNFLRHSVPRDENELNDRQPSSSQEMQATIQDGRDGYLDVVPGPIYIEPGHETDGQPGASQQLLRHSVSRNEDEITDGQPSSSQEMQAMIKDREDGYLEAGPIYESID